MKDERMSQVKYAAGTKCESCGAINMVEAIMDKGEITFWCSECGGEVGLTDSVVWLAAFTVAQMRRNFRVHLMFCFLLFLVGILGAAVVYLYLK